MRIVLDTNVLIAAFIARGACHELLEHCILHHSLATSEFILAELKQKLIEKFGFTAARAGEVEVLLRSRMQVVVPISLGFGVCRDPEDDNVLAAAKAGNCDCIITGDKDLLALKEFDNIFIVSPAAFPTYEAQA